MLLTLIMATLIGYGPHSNGRKSPMKSIRVASNHERNIDKSSPPPVLPKFERSDTAIDPLSHVRRLILSHRGVVRKRY
jgi:hypothetical protein